MKNKNGNIVQIPLHNFNKKDRENGNYWFIIILFFFCSFFMGFYGFSIHYSDNHAGNLLGLDTDILYKTIQLFVLEFPSDIQDPNGYLNAGRFLAPLVTLGSIFLLLSSLIIRWLWFQKIRWYNTDHVIICGLTALGINYAKYFKSQGKSVIIVDPFPEEKQIDEIRSNHITLLTADPKDSQLLSDIRVSHASVILAVQDDNSNIEIFSAIRRIRTADSLKCLVHISDPEICSSIQVVSEKNLDFSYYVFNQSLIAGVNMVHASSPQFPVVIKGKSLHIMIIGSDGMVQAILIELARFFQYIRRTNSDTFHCQITLIDPHASSIVNGLNIRHPELKTLYTLIPRDIHPSSYNLVLIEEISDIQKWPDIVYICTKDDSLSYHAALVLNDKLNADLTTQRIPINVRCENGYGFELLMRELKEKSRHFFNITLFPYLEKTCNLEWVDIHMDIESLAKAIHRDYCFNQSLTGMTPETNESMKPWEEISDSLKNSNRDQARDIVHKLETVGYSVVHGASSADLLVTFSDNEVEVLAEHEHERWMRERFADGWVYGEQKDLDCKISPYLVPYDELTDEVKEYDRQAIRAIPGLLASLGLAIKKNEER